jgi:hypothetical protein
MIISRTYIRSLSQLALLEVVTINLRAVIVSMLPEELLFNFYYEKTPSVEEINLSQLFLKRISSHLEDKLVRYQLIVLPQIEVVSIKRKDQVVYQRYEGDSHLFKIRTFFNEFSITNIRAAFQFALLGCITRNLRAISIMILEKNATVNFYYNRNKIKDEGVLFIRIPINFSSCFEGVTTDTNSFIIPEPEQIRLQKNAIWVYKRYEKDFLAT